MNGSGPHAPTMVSTTGSTERYAGSVRDVYRRALLDLARIEERVFCLEADVGGFENTFAAEFPERYGNVGIAEANLMGMAAGLAAVGWLPYVHTFSSFAACRACEQLKIDIAGNNLPVRVVVTHGGLSAGHYGPSHHALEDVAIVRAMPNMTLIVPADAIEAEKAVSRSQIPSSTVKPASQSRCISRWTRFCSSGSPPVISTSRHGCFPTSATISSSVHFLPS